MKFSPVAEGVEKSEAVFRTNKETYDMEADFTESQKQTAANSIPNPVVTDHGINGPDFAQQLKEIDNELGIYEAPQTLGNTENSVSTKESQNSFDMENLRNELAPNKIQAGTLLREISTPKSHACPLQDVTNYSHAPKTIENSSQTKWKCLVREFTSKTPITEDPIGPKRPIDMVVDIWDVPRKKVIVSNEDKENYSVLAEADSQPC